MAAIALPSFLNQANRARTSTASTSNREIDSLTGMSEIRIGTAAFTLKQPHSDVESKSYVGSAFRTQQAYFFESADFLTGESETLVTRTTFPIEQPRSNLELNLTTRDSRPREPFTLPELLVVIYAGATDSSSQAMGGEGVVGSSRGALALPMLFVPQAVPIQA